MFRNYLPAALLFALVQFAAAPASLAQPQPASVLATLKPLQLIALAITEGISQPQQLLPSNASPHDYQLRPSDMRKLQDADLLIWVGPELERFVAKPLSQRSAEKALLTLQTLVQTPPPQAHPQRQSLQQAEPQPFRQHDQHETHETHEHETHKHEPHEKPAPGIEAHDAGSHHGADLHLWLGPDQAAMIADAIATSLVQLDPANAAGYRHNLARFLTRLTALDEQLQQQLSAVRERGYFVFHDAYAAFEAHYHLRHLGAFTLNPQRQPGARHLADIRRQLQNSQAYCVFAEPQFKPAVLQAITEGLPVGHGELDPLATAVPATADGYLIFLQQLADSFSDCLTP